MIIIDPKPEFKILYKNQKYPDKARFLGTISSITPSSHDNSKKKRTKERKKKACSLYTASEVQPTLPY